MSGSRTHRDLRPPATKSQSPTPPPKAVHFPSTSSGPVSSISRPPTTIEAWSFYNFETHARTCVSCHNNLLRSQKHKLKLCPTGEGLALDLCIHVYSAEGVVYSAAPGARVRLEVPRGYPGVRGLLEAGERGVWKRATPVVVVGDERTARRADEAGERAEVGERYHPRQRRRAAEVILEPARTERKSRDQRRGADKYRTVVVNDERELNGGEDEDSFYYTTTASARHATLSVGGKGEKRGSLYERDMQRATRREGYYVEVREPGRGSSSKEERGKEREREKGKRRDSGVWI